MRHYEASSLIAADAEAVWAVLSNGPGWAARDSGVDAVEGRIVLGLFRGVRTYALSPAASGGTAFQMREEYTGPLLGLIWRSMPDLGPSFERFARGLKMRVESGN